MPSPPLPRRLSGALAALALPLLGLCLAALPATADEVILKDGSVVRGEVLESNDDAPLRIRVVRGQSRVVVDIPRADIRWVRPLDSETERTLTKVEALLLEGKHDPAIALLRKLVEQHPRDARAQRELGFALLLRNDFKGGIEVLQRACALDPLDLESHLALARAQEQLRQLDGAIETYRKACLLGPTHSRVFRRLGELLLERQAQRLDDPNPSEDDLRAAKKDRAEALRAYERAARIDPLDEGIALERAATLLAGEDEQEHQRAVEVLKAFLRKAPQAAGAVRMLAQIEAAQGDPKLALLRIVGLLKREDLPAPLRQRLEAEAALYSWLQSGAKTPAPPGMDAGDPKVDLAQARLRLVFLLDLLPEDARLQLALARVELRAGEIDEARTWLDRVVLSEPKEVHPDAALLQHVCLDLLRAKLLPNGSAPETFFGEGVALPKARRLVRLAPWLTAAHRTMGQALERETQFKAAAQAYADGIAWSAGADKESLIKAAQAALEKAKRAEKHRDL
ncbi:MAG TPA: hypothetical protein DEA08_15050 [Planctomycetes bacterium]|nr:hypothetical protein [Planctomycetota bacterium]